MDGMVTAKLAPSAHLDSFARDNLPPLDDTDGSAIEPIPAAVLGDQRPQLVLADAAGRAVARELLQHPDVARDHERRHPSGEERPRPRRRR